MFIAKKHLSRRAVLRGMGATLALPFLDSLVPAQTPLRRTAAFPRSRLVCLEMVHGSAGSSEAGSSKHYWSPDRAGSDFDFSYTLEPLAPFSIIHHDCQRHGFPPGGGLCAQRSGWRPFPFERGVSYRNASETDRGL